LREGIEVGEAVKVGLRFNSVNGETASG